VQQHLAGPQHHDLGGRGDQLALPAPAALSAAAVVAGGEAFIGALGLERLHQVVEGGDDQALVERDAAVGDRPTEALGRAARPRVELIVNGLIDDSEARRVSARQRRSR